MTPAQNPDAGQRSTASPSRGDAAGRGNTPKALSPTRYLAWLYSTDAQKPVLATLLEIEAEIASGLRPGMEHHVAHARLQWWSEEGERVAQGRPVHPLTKELVKAHTRDGIPAGEASARSIAAAAAALAAGSSEPPAPPTIAPLTGISGLVGTALWDLARATFETRKELTAYCERWSAAMFETAASARGGTTSRTRDLTPGPAPATRDPMPAAAPATHDPISGTAPATRDPMPGTAPATRDPMPGPAPATHDPVSGTAPAPHDPMPGTAPATRDPAPGAAPAAGDLIQGATPKAVGIATRGWATDTPATVGIAAPDEASPASSAWKSLGTAVREIELLAGAARDAHAGRVRLPLDELDRVGVDPNALAKLPWPAPLAALLKERHQALRAVIATNVAALPREDQMRLRGLLVWVTLTWRLSVRAERALPNVILPRRYDALAYGWQAWRAARRAATGKFRLG